MLSPWPQSTVQVITLQGHGGGGWYANHKTNLPQLYVHLCPDSTKKVKVVGLACTFPTSAT